MFRNRRSLRQLVCIAVLCVPLCARAADRPTVVAVDAGKVQGAVADGVVSFKGIPFAAPPVGSLRWRAPQPPKTWTGVRSATAYGNDCMQNPFPSDAAPLGTKPAEDCLYVNVWAPQGATGEKLPVMVWIYGGGFVNGGSSPAVYDGSEFARKGVVFVSFNYRLGRFGFFAHPALTAENADGMLGNYAYMDQIAALKWVQKNIAAFGGDAGNVTVFGESAGGSSVHMLLTSPLTAGLFHKAIVESGGGRRGANGQRYLSTQVVGGPPSAESVGVAFAKSNGIEGTDAQALAAMRALPADKVVDGLNMANRSPTFGGPMVDGKIVVADPESIYLTGGGQKVPIMVGGNSADAGGVRGATVDAIFAPFGVDADRARTAYGAQSMDAADPKALMSMRLAVGADRGMIEPARFVARVFASRGLPAYEFRFSYVAESMRKQWKGAPHATEIPFVFDTVKARYLADLTAADEKTAQAALSYWVAFAKTGDPGTAGGPQWPRYTVGQDMLMDFTWDGPVAEADPWKARLDVTGDYVSANAPPAP